MSKAEQIYDLYWSGQGLTDAQIADRVGCHINYVRVCARQRAGRMSDADVKYAEKKKASGAIPKALNSQEVLSTDQGEQS